MNKRSRTTNKKCFIIGSGLIVLDIILNNGDSSPIFKAGGTCGNVLAGLSYMGWESVAVARSGTDSAGRLMMKNLSDCGVNVASVTREDSFKTPRIVERLKSNGTNPKHTFLLRCPACLSYLPRFQSPTLEVVEPVISDHEVPAVFFFDRVSPAILRLAQKYRDLGALIFYEPNNLRNLQDIERAVALCHVIKYSGGETEAASTTKEDCLLKKNNPPLIVKTLGKEGILFSLSKSDVWHHQKGAAVNKLWDTCGAGDWCTVGLLYFLNEFAASKRISLRDTLSSYPLIKIALQYAQMLSALSCGFVGARGLSDAVARNDLIRAIEQCIAGKTDIKIAVDTLATEKFHALRTSNKVPDIAACKVCLLSERK
jgi:sugar/nucleoside kinase (ribokinase family)